MEWQRTIACAATSVLAACASALPNGSTDTPSPFISFAQLVVVCDGRVLFRNVSGQASTDRTDRQTNPLGPFQLAGESAGAVLVR